MISVLIFPYILYYQTNMHYYLVPTWLVFRVHVFSIKVYLTEVPEQPRGGTHALNVKAIRDRRHANVSKQRTLLADVDIAPPHGVA